MDRTKKSYKAIPEEFYSCSGRKVIRPENCLAWLSVTSSKRLRWQFQELCSGSGRLSLTLLLTGMAVGFPVDYRYGWDLAHPTHQSLLRACHEEFQPDHLFAAPSCSPWSVASSTKAPDLRAADRQAELPTLHFLKEQLFLQHSCDRGLTLEQPLNSAMLREEPMVRLFDLETVRKHHSSSRFASQQHWCQIAGGAQSSGAATGTGASRTASCRASSVVATAQL